VSDVITRLGIDNLELNVFARQFGQKVQRDIFRRLRIIESTVCVFFDDNRITIRNGCAFACHSSFPSKRAAPSTRRWCTATKTLKSVKTQHDSRFQGANSASALRAPIFSRRKNEFALNGRPHDHMKHPNIIIVSFETKFREAGML
jgi:hypothetical protein